MLFLGTFSEQLILCQVYFSYKIRNLLLLVNVLNGANSYKEIYLECRYSYVHQIHHWLPEMLAACELFRCGDGFTADYLMV